MLDNIQAYRDIRSLCNYDDTGYYVIGYMEMLANNTLKDLIVHV